MAKFRLTTPDGAVYSVEAPDETAAMSALSSLYKGKLPEQKPPSNMGFGGREQREADPTPEDMRAAYQEQARGARERMNPIAAKLDTFARGVARAVPFMDDIAAAGDYYLLGKGASYQDALARQRGMNAADDADRPALSYGGQIAGAIPLPGAALANSGMKGAALVGAGYGALSGAGAGDSLADRARMAATGAAFGGVAGPVAQKAVQGAGLALGYLGDRVGAIRSIARGIGSPEDEAAARIGRAFKADSGTGISPGAFEAAQQQGVPLIAADAGGETVRALARSAANTSPVAREALGAATDAQYYSQAPRMRGFMLDMAGSGGDVEGTREAMKAAAKAANAPLYRKAEAEGANGIWHEGLSQLMQAPEVVAAVKAAERTGANKAAATGFKAARNPFVDDGSGMMALRVNPDGSTARPTLAFWDMVKQNLDDAIGRYQRSGDMGAARDATMLKRQLVSYLDEAAPTYAAARAGAAKAFGAEDALDAGAKFVSSNMPNIDARKAFAKMSEPERKLFQDGFASELANKIESLSDKRDVINSIFGSPKAREKVEIALGPARMKEFEVRLRLEDIMTQTRRAVQGNSTTARQLIEAGIAGGAANTMATGDYSPGNFALGAALGGMARQGVAKVDARVAARVGDMLASSDPRVVEKAVRAAANTRDFTKLLDAVQAGLVKSAAQQSGDIDPFDESPPLATRK